MQPESLCPTHQADRDRHQRQTTPTKVTRTWAEQQRRKQAVDAHRAIFGDWCPGYEKHGPHQATDLTADHVHAIANGGAPDGRLVVRCRSCNSARSNRYT